ncbi:MAG TPA: twin-arginine translocation signal domain-containing protein, partial [Petrimonas sp.]|nr:twin-arginine translocation signal domain-containing protein [Petrimonas sp.]
MQNNRRDFIKKAALAGASVAVIPALSACNGAGKSSSVDDNPGIKSKL